MNAGRLRRGKRSLKELAARVYRWSGLAWAVRRIFLRRKVAVLMYHDPEPDVLERHLAYLSGRYGVLTLDQLVDAISRRDWSGMPRHGVVITIDDGLAGNLRLLPVFRRFGVWPTLYVCTGIVGTRRHYWWTTTSSRRERDELKRMSGAEREQALLDRYGFSATREYPDRQALRWEDIETMLPDVDVQAHSRFHPVLTTLDLGEARDEIVGSKTDIERFTARACDHFCYPNGSYTEREREIVIEAGYLSARTTEPGWNDMATDPFALRISGVADDGSVSLLAADLSGLLWMQSRLGALARSRLAAARAWRWSRGGR